MAPVPDAQSLRLQGPQDHAPTQHQLEALLALALSQPLEARATAVGLLDAHPRDLRLVSYARQAIGIVLRDAGDPHGAIVELRAAARAARRTGDSDRRGDVLATLGVAQAQANQTRAALATFDAALHLTRGLTRARVLLRRAHVLIPIGRVHEALADLRFALATTRRAHDELWQARCLVHRGWAFMTIGEFDRAESDQRAARALFARVGQLHEAAWVLNNTASLRWYRGDLPVALELLDEAVAHFSAEGHVPLNTSLVRAHVLLSAGLAPEVLELVEECRELTSRDPLVGAELLVVGALAALEIGEPELAIRLSEGVSSLTTELTRGSWITLAPIIALQARSVQERTNSERLRHAARTADELPSRDPLFPLTHLLVGRLALDSGRPELARRHLSAAASIRGNVPPLSRVTGHLAAALCTQLDGRPAGSQDSGILRACGHGLDAFHEHASGLGDRELRALASEHAQALADLALRTALRGSPRRLLRWTERVRASSLTTPPARPPDDPELARAVASAREAESRLLSGELDEAAIAQARRDQARHEGTVRRRYRQLSTQGGTRASDLNVRELVAAVGTDALVSLVHVYGILYAVRVHRGRVTRHEVGPLATALRESEFARFAMRRAAYGRVPDLIGLGGRLESALLGGLGDRLPERVVIVPPAALHTAPWGLLPSLTDRVVGVAPSAGLWLRARQRPRTGPVVFVGGPGLSTEQAEVTANRRWYATGTTGPSRRVRTLTGPRATAAAVTRALDGAGIVHLAAHGSFRADAPLFSSVRMHDGPLYLYDLDRLHQAPHTVILSACDVGDTVAVGVDEGLGLVTGLLGFGTSAVLASTVPVNDAATVVVTGHLHDSLAAGADLPTAWRAARRHTRGDVLAAVSAASFTAWGA